MLRALTVILVVIGLLFVGWSLLVMTGGRDWLAATMVTAEKSPEKVAAKEETPPAEPAKAEPAPTEDAVAPGEDGESTEPGAGATATGGMDPGGSPMEAAKDAEKGALKSPYRDDYAAVAEEGHKKYMAAGCNGCHGGTGGGGMGPPLSNPVWIYGNDGDTLFRLIALGSDGLHAQGYVRKGSENVVGPMPPHGTIVKSNDDMWKIIGWIWSINPPD